MSKRILVVEDQPDSRRIIRDMLAPTDYEIIEAENGEQALAAIAKQRPDLILMDVQLPIMDGYTATRRIKADPALRSITIIAVTSYAPNGEEQIARAAGRSVSISPRPPVLLRCMSLLLAQSGHPGHAQRCPLWGVKRTSPTGYSMSAFDPKRTW
jgi:two-component system, cell cycle response regulator DivK